MVIGRVAALQEQLFFREVLAISEELHRIGELATQRMEELAVFLVDRHG